MERERTILVSARTNIEASKNFAGRGRLWLVISLFVLATLACCALAQDAPLNYSQNKADYWYKRGLESTGLGNFDDALQSFSKAIQMDPKNAAIWNGKALALRALYFSKHDPNSYNESLKAYDKAIELYNESLQLNPQDVNTWYYKGLALSDKTAMLQAGDSLNITNDGNCVTGYEEAIKAYDQATRINPAYLTAWKNKGNVLYALAKYNESIQAYDQAIEIDKKYALAWYGKGLALTKLEDYDEAVKAYDNAIEASPNNPAIWYNKGIALSSQGKHDAAIRCYDQATKLNQSYVEAWNGKGAAYEALGFETEAKAAFAKARYLASNT